MTTGIIGTLVAAGSIAYTPLLDAKVNIGGNTGSTGTVAANGVTLVTISNTEIRVTVFVGASQTLTVTTTGNATSIVTALEGTPV